MSHNRFSRGVSGCFFRLSYTESASDGHRSVFHHLASWRPSNWWRPCRPGLVTALQTWAHVMIVFGWFLSPPPFTLSWHQAHGLFRVRILKPKCALENQYLIAENLHRTRGGPRAGCSEASPTWMTSGAARWWKSAVPIWSTFCRA